MKKILNCLIVVGIFFSFSVLLCLESGTKSINSTYQITDNFKGTAFANDVNIANPDSKLPTPTNLDNNIVPPIGFNPITASDSDLKKYHFPERPTDPAREKDWEQAMSHAKEYVTPILDYSKTNARHNTWTTSDLWAGLVIPKSSFANSPKITETDITYVLPRFNSSAFWCDPCFWTGIGGYGTNNIVQAGADINALLFGGSTQYELWFEDYPYGPVYTLSPAIRPGDTLYIQTTWLNSGSSGSYVYYMNETTGKYTYLYFNGKYYDGSSADYIYEATNKQYCSWGHVNFSDCNACTEINTWGNAGNLNFIGLHMYDKNGNLKAYTISSGIGTCITSY